MRRGLFHTVHWARGGYSGPPCAPRDWPRWPHSETTRVRHRNCRSHLSIHTSTCGCPEMSPGPLPPTGQLGTGAPPSSVLCAWSAPQCCAGTGVALRSSWPTLIPRSPTPLSPSVPPAGRADLRGVWTPAGLCRLRGDPVLPSQHTPTAQAHAHTALSLSVSCVSPASSGPAWTPRVLLSLPRGENQPLVFRVRGAGHVTCAEQPPHAAW